MASRELCRLMLAGGPVGRPEGGAADIEPVHLLDDVNLCMCVCVQAYLVVIKIQSHFLTYSP